MGAGESGTYSFDADGAPAVGGNNLTYGPGDIKKRSVENTIRVNDTWGAGESGFYNFDANGAPATGAARLAYNPGDIKKQQVVGSTTGNLTWGDVSQDFMILMQMVLLLRVLHDWPTILGILRSNRSQPQ